MKVALKGEVIMHNLCYSTRFYPALERRSL